MQSLARPRHITTRDEVAAEIALRRARPYPRLVPDPDPAELARWATAKAIRLANEAVAAYVKATAPKAKAAARTVACEAASAAVAAEEAGSDADLSAAVAGLCERLNRERGKHDATLAAEEAVRAAEEAARAAVPQPLEAPANVHDKARRWSDKRPELTLRLDKALALVGGVFDQGGDVFRVEGAGDVYTVTVDRAAKTSRCTCPDSQYGHHCKHRLAVALVVSP